MSKRHNTRKEYSDCKKTAAPACCSMRCCGNKFGIIGASNNVRNGAKTRMRRYHRHATKVMIKTEILSEVEYAADEIAAYERMRDE